MSKPNDGRGDRDGRDDNVIYANFTTRTRVASAAETGPSVAGAVHPSRGGLKDAARGGLSAAAKRVVNAAASQTDAGRVKRGRAYAEGGNVVALRLGAGRVDAEVVGSQNEPFATGLLLPPRTPQELQEALRAMAAHPGASERAARGDFPPEVLDALLAPEAGDFRFYCDCPDSAAVCKHSVALAEVLAQKIDAEPLSLFTLRNLSPTVVEETVRSSARSLAQENASEGSPFFWSGRELPDLPRPKVAPMIDDSDTDLLRHALETVSFTNIDLLNAVADIEDLYDLMSGRE